MTPTKEQLAEEYQDKTVPNKYFGFMENVRTRWAKEDFLAGFQARDEQLKEFVGRMKELSQAMPPNAVSMEIYRALQKIRMRDEAKP